jgi:hypothetical protein
MTLAFLPHRQRWSIPVRMARMLEEFESMNKDNAQAGVSRREALTSLALLPLTTLGLAASSETPKPVEIEDVLTQCSASVPACGYLSKGTREEMDLAFSALSGLLPTLKAIVKESALYRRSAALLTAQALLIKATVAIHRRGEGPDNAARYAKDGLTYSEASGDLAIRLILLRRLAYISTCQKDWQQAAEYAIQAQSLLEQSNKPLPPLIQNATYYGAAKYRAQNGQQDDIPALLDQAHANPLASTEDEATW